MNIYVSHASSFDYQKELYEPLRSSSLADQHEFFFPHDPENAGKDTREVIADSDLVVAEVSYPSTGQGIELERAYQADLYILALNKKGTVASHSLQFVEAIIQEYDSFEGMERRIADFIESLAA